MSMDEMLAQWRRFSELTADMGAQDRLQFILTVLGEEGVKELNDKIEKMFGPPSR